MSEERARVSTEFSGDFLRSPSAVIVESWHRKNGGRVKRAWLQEFTEKERRTLGSWHTTMYGWHMRTGLPLYTRMSVETYSLIVRAADFFARF